MMRNTRNELYNKLTTNYKCEKDSFNNVKEILNPDYIQCFIDVKNKEKEFAVAQTKKHFDDRLKWIIEIKEERLSKAVPDIIDGIDMRDKNVPTTYDIEPKIYGGVKIDSNEAAVLKLPPKFSRIYKPDKLDFKANLEKSFMCLRWKKAIESSTKCDNDKNNRNIENNHFYDFETKTFNLKDTRATSVPFNKRIVIPPLANDNYESKIQFARNKLKKVIDKFERKRDNNNESTEVTNGIKSLKKRLKNKEIICYPTDKSGSLNLDTYENYIENMQVHLKDMVEVTEEEYKSTEHLLNCHMQSWCRILNATERMTRNFITSNNDIPPLYGLRKDHKVITDEIKGPPSRPVCGAVTSCNFRISYFLSQLIKPLIQEAPECCDSTEDLLSKIHVINETEDLTDCVLGSMDVEALYTLHRCRLCS